MRGAAEDMGWVVLILVSIAGIIIGTERTIKWYKARKQRKRIDAEMHDLGI